MVPISFRRRLKHHKFELEMRNNIESAFMSSGGQKELFIKYLLNQSLFRYFSSKYNILVTDEFTKEEFIEIRDYLYGVYKPLIDLYFSNARKRSS